MAERRHREENSELSNTRKQKGEMPDTQNYTCHCCGATVPIDAVECSYCENPVRITTFQSVWSLPNPTVNKYLSSYKKDAASGENGDATAPLAFCYLKLKLYDKARLAFEDAMAENFDNSEVFFYAAACCLKGKKAFLAPRPDIDQALEYVEAARMIEPRAIYDYLLAYIKQDFFSRKGYRINPGYEEELSAANAKGIAAGDVAHLFDVLAVQRPAQF
jgi:tetratricopeptide (TPR) repeat protein